MSVSYRNRTYNRVLGGPRYIHLTKETNAVFPGFFDPLAPAAIIYNSITSVMNYLFLISSDFSDFASPVTLERYPFSSEGFRHGSTLGGACYIHLTMGTTSVFSGFSAFSVTATNFMNSSTFVWRIHRNSQLKKATLYILTNNTLKVKTSKLHFTRKAVLKS